LERLTRRAACSGALGEYLAPMSAAPQTAPVRFDRVDRVYLALRVLALGVGLAYTMLPACSPDQGLDLLISFGVFIAYSVTIYAGGWTLFSTHQKGRFYWTLGALDFVFLVVLVHVTGGGTSPFYRAFYLWIAMAAFYSGQRGGSLASAVAFVAYVWFFWLDEAGEDAWSLVTKVLGLLFHGPLIGYLVDRDRKLIAKLSAMERELGGKPEES
jgi:hypothetical protein